MPNIRNTKTLEAYKEILKLKIEVDRLQIDKKFDDVKLEVEQFSIIEWTIKQFDIGRMFHGFISNLVTPEKRERDTTDEPHSGKNDWLKEVVSQGMSIAARKFNQPEVQKS